MAMASFLLPGVSRGNKRFRKDGESDKEDSSNDLFAEMQGEASLAVLKDPALQLLLQLEARVRAL